MGGLSLGLLDILIEREMFGEVLVRRYLLQRLLLGRENTESVIAGGMVRWKMTVVVCVIMFFERWRRDRLFFVFLREALANSFSKMINEGLGALVFRKFRLTVLFLHLG